LDNLVELAKKMALVETPVPSNCFVDQDFNRATILNANSGVGAKQLQQASMPLQALIE